MAYIRGTYTYYCTKKGSAGNNGTTEALATNDITHLLNGLVANVQDGSAVTAAIGEGIYYVDFLGSGGPNSNAPRHIYGIGKVVIRGKDLKNFKGFGGVTTFHNIIFEDFLDLGIVGSTSSYRWNFEDCEIKNSTVSPLSSNSKADYKKCTFKTCVIGNGLTFTNCKFLEGCTPYGSIVTSLYSSDVDESSLICSGAGTSYSYNNIRGKIKHTSTGVVYNTLAEYQAVYAGSFPNSFSADPKYISPEGNNYYVKTDSPNLKTGNLGSNIGNVKTGYGAWVDSSINGDTALDLAANINVVEEFIRSLGVAYTIEVGETYAWVKSDWYAPLNGKMAKLTLLSATNNEEFDTDYVGGSIENMNVLSADTTGRRTYYAMWSNRSVKPTDLSDIDNSAADNGLVAETGEWHKFYWDGVPRIDALGVSSGNDNFDWQQTNPPLATPDGRWFRLWIWLRNDYVG